MPANRPDPSSFGLHMSVETVVVCEAQVPFVTGGAESHVRALVTHLRAHGFSVELVSLPFRWTPKEELLSHAAAWRLINLSESNGRPIDLVIATKFPTYFVRHSNKVAWLIHQYRAVYELCDTDYSDFGHTDRDVGLRQSLIDLDTRMLGECRRLFANAQNTAQRLAKFNGLRAEPLYHPPRLVGQLHGGDYGNYVLSVGRLESVKRVDLLINAMPFIDPPVKLLVVGDGSQRDALAALARDGNVGHRIELLGQIDDEQLVDLYAGALAVLYAPYDEDYGYVTLESFLARKPVVTATDSGGTLEFVEHDINGKICEPTPEAIAAAVNALVDDRRRAASLGDAGYERARAITWDGVIEKLVGTS